MVLRRRMPQQERPFQVPAYPWVPLVFLVGTGVGLGAIVWGEAKSGNWSPVFGLLLSTVGFPVYFVWRRVSRGSAPAPAVPEAPSN